VGLREEIKSRIAIKDMTMTEVVNELNERLDKDYSLANFSSKLSRSTLKYEEIEEIADILGYEIKWVEKEKDQR